MEVSERALTEAIHRVEAEPGTGDAAWFAARQPAVVKFLESRLGRDDLMGVALMAAFAIHAAFERSLGAPPPRVRFSDLLGAEDSVVAEARSGQPSFLERQQALAAYLAALIAAPPIPLAPTDSSRHALILGAIIQAFDRSS